MGRFPVQEKETNRLAFLPRLVVGAGLRGPVASKKKRPLPPADLVTIMTSPVLRTKMTSPVLVMAQATTISFPVLLPATVREAPLWTNGVPVVQTH